MFIIFFITIGVGAVLGCILEFLYKSITRRKICAPQFVNVQMYVYTAVLVYVLFLLQISFVLNILIIVTFTTGIEYIIGYRALKKGNRLWDYRDEWLNYKGIICPKFSFLWLIIASFILYVFYPWLSGIEIFRGFNF